MGTPRTKASAKYNDKAYERFLITVKKGDKEIIERRARLLGKSINKYIVDLIEEDLKED